MLPQSKAAGCFADAMRYVRNNFIFVGIFSCVINILMLTGPLFMLQVYDRVLSSGSVDTLLALAVLAGLLYAFMGFLEAIRSRMLAAIGHGFDAKLAGTAFTEDLTGTLRGGASAVSTKATTDVGQLRSFFASPAVASFFDMPWMPFYLGLVFALHFWLGIVGLIGAAVLVVLAVVSDLVTRRASRDLRALTAASEQIAQSSRRNVEAIQGMGMHKEITQLWRGAHDRLLAASAKSAKLNGISTSITKVFRLALQSVTLAVGAYLVIDNAATGGVMIAASIIMTKGLQPIEGAMQNWRTVLAAQRSYRSLKKVFATPATRENLSLPRPSSRLEVERITVLPPAQKKPSLMGVNFAVEAGKAVAVIGATGSGKSTLGRALTGIWPAAAGKVSLDAVPLDQWIPEDLGRDIGYLPQDVELFEGTIAQNIARFQEDAKDEDIIEAAKAAGVHELITSFEGGYTARVGDRGAALSGGQRQRIGLARALYGKPFLLVLDEPNANLDGAGEGALNQAIMTAKQRGAIVVIIAHRPSALATVDFILRLDEGRMADFGARDEMIRKLMPAPKPAAAPAQTAGQAPAQAPAPLAAPLPAPLPASAQKQAIGAIQPVKQAVATPPAAENQAIAQCA